MEPHITINGISLSEAQAMTVRVAVGAFALDLHQHGLGEDEHGQRMRAVYLARIGEIVELLERSTNGRGA